MSLWKTFEKLNNLYESKQDVDTFIDKFGQETYDLFKKSTQRLKNKNISTDLVWHTKHTEKKDLETILYNLQNRTITKDGEANSEMAGEYKFLGEEKGYKVYEILDHIAAVNLGGGTGWCIAGRYNHYGEENYSPDIEEARGHWDSYTKDDGARIFYFIPANSNEKVACVVYPTVEENKDGSESNYELFNVEDKPFKKDWKLPLDLIPATLESYSFTEREIKVTPEIQERLFKSHDFITTFKATTKKRNSPFKDVPINELILEEITAVDKIISYKGEAISSSFSVWLRTFNSKAIKDYLEVYLPKKLGIKPNPMEIETAKRKGIRMRLEINAEWETVIK